MGCLNSDKSFGHWFGNIHLSGPCNRHCYFCIGQHMMALDAENTLGTYPLPGLDLFIEQCNARGVSEVFVTGTNTDPLLYRETAALTARLRRDIPGVVLGLRTNAAAWRTRGELAQWYDKGSVTVCSLDRNIYQAMMGVGEPPILEFILGDVYLKYGWSDLKVNIVLGPENRGPDLLRTLDELARLGVERVNLREPYGQPHVGDPLASTGAPPMDTAYGMPVYYWRGTRVTYWDVHYCEVESINLYASGRVSEDYPITRGHAPDGTVEDQSSFRGGRVREQWRKLRVVSP